jgi:hypothetical protein
MSWSSPQSSHRAILYGPSFGPFEELEALRNELPNSKWQAQYQQSPTSDTSAIIKREWWKIWEDEDPPHVRVHPDVLGYRL